MARKKRSFGKKSNGGSVLKNVCAGVGAATLTNQVLGGSLGSMGPIAGYGAAYYVGGMPGVLGAFLAPQLGGLLGGITTGITGGAATSGATF